MTGSDGTKIHIDSTFLTNSPYLVDSLYVVGGTGRNQAKFMQEIEEYVQVAYKHYKPIGVATTGQSFLRTSKQNNLAGVVFAANNPNFGEEFVAAIAQHRFWDRT